MATTLTSPGVLTTITDDSSYASGTATTVPLFIIGTQANKTTSSGATAEGTLSANAGTLYNITSQQNLVQTFGNPLFYSNDGTPINGYELNEYGLLTAYQFFGLYDNAYVLRADIDYAQLVSTDIEPTSSPQNGTVWLDTSNTSWGLMLSSGGTNKVTSWVAQAPIVVSEDSDTEYTIMGRAAISSTSVSVTSSDGKIVINGTSVDIPASSTIVSVVSAINSASISGVTASTVYVAGAYYILISQSTVASTETINVSGSTATTLTALGLIDSSGNAYSANLQPKSSIGSAGSFAVVTTTNSNIYYQKITSTVSGDTNASLANTLWYPIGSDIWTVATQKSKFYSGNYNSLPSTSNAGDVWLNTVAKASGIAPSVKIYSASLGTWSVQTVGLYSSVSSFPEISSTGTITCVYSSVSGIASFTLYIYTNGSWEPLSYSAGPTTPTSTASDGTLWYNNNDFIADIMINQNGNEWVGYRSYASQTGTDPNGPIMAGSQPTTQSTGSSLVDGDLWVDTADTENYPMLYRWSATEAAWVEIDNTDDYSPNGIIFKDARADDGTGSTDISDLLTSDNLDPDAPNPELYPDGLLLFNTRVSTNNVKKWNSNYFGAGGYSAADYTRVGYTVGTQKFSTLTSKGRWVSVSGNAEDGSPYMGRKAQRRMIVQALKAVVTDSTEILAEDNYFTLICAPGYIELISDMVTVSENKNNTVFVIGDTPARLASDATSISAFANPSASQTEDSEDAIVTASSYLAVYYPWGLTTNVDGSTVMVPPSTIAIRTIGYSDSISYPWYAPAGYTRGLVSNATSVGYLDSTTGNFVASILNNGQRNVLYENSINPIAYMSGHGLVIWGQKTRDATTQASDRINVARLSCYLAYNLNKLGYPFLFEQNTETLRSSVQTTFTKYLNNLVALDALYDFDVVCDDTNNTDTTIDANELWIDIAIQPVKTIEFIYIPVRLVNTGTDMAALLTGASSSSSS